MRAMLAVSMLAMTAAGCASSSDLRALQAPPPPPQGIIRFDDSHPYRGAVSLESVGGVSRRSYLFAEPNQRMLRPIIEDALENSGLRAGTPERGRYGLRVEVTDADGPTIGADYEAKFEATYTLIDRNNGARVWSRSVSTPGQGAFLGFNEADWEGAWYIQPVTGLVSVANPMNFLPFASDSAAERARRQGLYGDQARANDDRQGRRRAARANYAAVATNVASFLVQFSRDNNVGIIPILPCWGSPEVEAIKQQILASGGTYTTDNCMAPR